MTAACWPHRPVHLPAWQVKEEGFEVAHDGYTVTIFSAPKYCDQMVRGRLGRSERLQPGRRRGATLDAGASCGWRADNASTPWPA